MPCGTKVGVAYVDMISVEPTPTEMVTWRLSSTFTDSRRVARVDNLLDKTLNRLSATRSQVHANIESPPQEQPIATCDELLGNLKEA